MVTYNVIDRVREALTDDLLQPKYRNSPRKSDVEGHCYAAAEAVYHLLGGKAAGLTPMVGRDAEGGTHWWLRDSDGKIIDPTGDQYEYLGMERPYDTGKGAGFLIKEPSIRAREIMKRVGGK